MEPSATAAGATAVQSESQGPPFSGDPSNHSSRTSRNGAAPGPDLGASPQAARKWGRPRPNSPMSSELGHLMQEPFGGPNYGRRASANPEVEGRNLPLDADDWQAAEFMRANGWTVARVKDPAAAGMAGHRGALHPDEFVDQEALRGLVEHELGFTLDELHSVYSTGGRIPSSLRELRGRIDARLLALSRCGANMDLFGRTTGLNASTLDRALARARAEEDAK